MNRLQKKLKIIWIQWIFSKQGLIDQLLFEGFTEAQAEYGAESVGF